DELLAHVAHGLGIGDRAAKRVDHVRAPFLFKPWANSTASAQAHRVTWAIRVTSMIDWCSMRPSRSTTTLVGRSQTNPPNGKCTITALAWGVARTLPTTMGDPEVVLRSISAAIFDCHVVCDLSARQRFLRR